MKKFIQHIIILFLAATISYGGAGINIYSYCCSDCSVYGADVILANKCCETHHHHHDHETTPDESDVCHDHAQDESCCSLENLSFDWSQVLASNIFIQAPVFVAGINDLLSISPTSISSFYSEIHPHHFDDPPFYEPRTYLAFIRVLLI
ncbi:MAG: hypothetical protein ACRDCN_11065 [Tannerellaceae bacterium]